VSRLVAPGLETLSAELMQPLWSAPHARPIVFHCWRGGLRSRSVVHFLRSVGCERATLLEGGWKSYREEVSRELGAWTAPPVVVLRGLTGVGKTLVLREVERLRPGSTLDLEACAGHRSSLLGMVGLQPASQKLFETRLAERLRALSDAPFLVLEGESRKVGDRIIPEGLWRALSEGWNLELVAPDAVRVRLLLEDYLSSARARQELPARLEQVQSRMARPKDAESLVDLYARGAHEHLVLELLERYYDPLYRHSEKGKHYAARIDTSDVAGAARAVLAWIEGRVARSSST
jgi:tRNA 2-selenouridine synthase